MYPPIHHQLRRRALLWWSCLGLTTDNLGRDGDLRLHASHARNRCSIIRLIVLAHDGGLCPSAHHTLHTAHCTLHPHDHPFLNFLSPHAVPHLRRCLAARCIGCGSWPFIVRARPLCLLNGSAASAQCPPPKPPLPSPLIMARPFQGLHYFCHYLHPIWT